MRALSPKDEKMNSDFCPGIYFTFALLGISFAILFQLNQKNLPVEKKDDILNKLNLVAGVLNGFRQDKDCVPKGSEYKVTLYETYLFLKVSIMELLAYDNSCKNAGSIIEKNTAISYFDLAIGEGITYLWGHGKNEKNTKLAGIRKMPDCDIKKEIINVIEKFKQDCDDCNLTTDEFKSAKECTKHYYSDPLDMIRRLTASDIQTEIKRVNSYLSTLVDISTYMEDFFNSQPINIFNTNKDIKKKNMECSVVTEESSNLNYLEEIKKGELTLIQLWELSKLLDKITSLSQTGALVISEAMNYRSKVRSLIYSSTPVWHSRKVSLDICYAIKSYFNAKNHLERQLGTYRMLISLYGGFSRLYGISEKERKDSVLANFRKTISSCYDITLSAQEHKLEKELKDFGIELKEKFGQTRHTLIHSRSGNKKHDLVLEKYYSMCELNPAEVYGYAVRFANIIHPLWAMTDAVLSYRCPGLWNTDGLHVEKYIQL